MKRTKRRTLAMWIGSVFAVLFLLIAGITAMSATAGNHTLRSVTYSQIPPNQGDHSPVWQRCGFYSKPVRDEHVVHSLEHGVVWVAYRPDLPADQIDQLRNFAAGQEQPIVSPYPGLPALLVVSAWGHQQIFDSLDVSVLGTVVGELRTSSGAPEPGGSCEGPNLWFSGATDKPETEDSD